MKFTKKEPEFNKMNLFRRKVIWILGRVKTRREDYEEVNFSIPVAISFSCTQSYCWDEIFYLRIPSNFLGTPTCFSIVLYGKFPNVKKFLIPQQTILEKTHD